MKDDGCEFSASCLTCLLPQCKYDMGPAVLSRWKALERYREQARLIEQEGLTVEMAAERFGVTVRTVYRMYQKLREVGEG